MVPGFVTPDANTLRLAQRLGATVQINANPNRKPGEIQLKPLSEKIRQQVKDITLRHVFIGGFAPTMAAYAHITHGKKNILCVDAGAGRQRSSHWPSIHPSSARHGEGPWADMPVAIGGYTPIHFFYQMASRILWPRQYMDTAKGNYPWKSLRITPWFNAMADVPQALLVLLRNQLMCLRVSMNPSFKKV